MDAGMITLERLKNHCLELEQKGLGYLHPHISATDLLVIISQLEKQANHVSSKDNRVAPAGDEKE